jgi:hypothetical protein
LEEWVEVHAAEPQRRNAKKFLEPLIFCAVVLLETTVEAAQEGA